MPPLEAWEKVFVGDEFLTSVHNTQNCIGCHGGVDGVDDMEAAHQGVVRDPIQDSDRVCAVCHTDAAEDAVDSLHRVLGGYRTALTARGADFGDDRRGQNAQNNHHDHDFNEGEARLMKFLASSQEFHELRPHPSQSPIPLE